MPLFLRVGVPFFPYRVEGCWQMNMEAFLAGPLPTSHGLLSVWQMHGMLGSPPHGRVWVCGAPKPVSGCLLWGAWEVWIVVLLPSSLFGHQEQRCLQPCCWACVWSASSRPEWLTHARCNSLWLPNLLRG